MSKPTITRKESSYYQVLASQKARKEAAQQGADPDHIDALMESGVEINGLHLKPLTMATIWALQKVGSVYSSEPSEAQVLDPLQICLGALCFIDPQRVFSLAKACDKDALEVEAFDLAMSLNPQHLELVNAWINDQMSDPHAKDAEEAEEKKPEPTPKIKSKS